MADISPEIQEQLKQFQIMQQQMQIVVSQKMQLDAMGKETSRALEELKKQEESAEVYKAVGRILIKSKKTDLEKELSESKETNDVRIKSLEKQEGKLKERLTQMQSALESELRPHTGG